MNSLQAPGKHTLTKKFNESQKVLEHYLTATHSAGSAEEGESFPPHLKEVIETYRRLKESSAESMDNPTVSQQNRLVQDEVIGTHVPVGPDTSASPRSSTRSENNRTEIALVRRGNDLADPAIIVEENSVLNTPVHHLCDLASDHITSMAPNIGGDSSRNTIDLIVELNNENDSGSSTKKTTNEEERKEKINGNVKKNVKGGNVKKRKFNGSKKKTYGDPGDTIDEAKDKMADALSKIADSHGVTKDTDRRIELDISKFDFEKVIVEKKISLSDKKMELKQTEKDRRFIQRKSEKEAEIKQRQAEFNAGMEIKNAEAVFERKKCRLMLLKEAMEQAKNDWTNENDTEMKDMLKGCYKDTVSAYRTAMKDIID